MSHKGRVHFIFDAMGEARRMVRRVTVIETYPMSTHYRVLIIPEGYGADVEPITFGTTDGEYREGYSTFRIEWALFFARAISMNTQYTIEYDTKGDQ